MKITVTLQLDIPGFSVKNYKSHGENIALIREQINKNLLEAAVKTHIEASANSEACDQRSRKQLHDHWRATIRNAAATAQINLPT